jgi:hypothetical protein
MIFFTCIHIESTLRNEDQNELQLNLASDDCTYLELLGNNCWRKKATQVVCIPLLLGEGKSLVVMRISQKGGTTVAEKVHQHLT